MYSKKDNREHLKKTEDFYKFFFIRIAYTISPNFQFYSRNYRIRTDITFEVSFFTTTVIFSGGSRICTYDLLLMRQSRYYCVIPPYYIKNRRIIRSLILKINVGLEPTILSAKNLRINHYTNSSK